jgi:hypothetical protein
MVDRTLRLSDELAAKIRVAAVATGLSSQQWIIAACDAAIQSMAQHDTLMATVFDQLAKQHKRGSSS